MIVLPPPVPSVLGALAGEVAAEGGRAWLVGGAVRDAILGRVPLDLDVAVEGLSGTTSVVAAALRGRGWVCSAEHDRFGTATFRSPEGLRVDLASTRSEKYPEPGALPVVTPGVAIEEDLRRRDFTIHAMAAPLGPEGPAASLLDPWGGEGDLRDRTIRLLHDRSLADDPTRAFRAARYAARLGFGLDSGFARALRIAFEGGSFARVSGDRLRRVLGEVLAEENRAVALAMLDRLGVPSLLVEGWSIGAGTIASLGAPSSPEEAWGRLLAGQPGEMRERVAGRLKFSRALRRAAGCPR